MNEHYKLFLNELSLLENQISLFVKQYSLLQDATEKKKFASKVQQLVAIKKKISPVIKQHLQTENAPLPTFAELYNDFRSSFAPIFDDLYNYSKILSPDSSSFEFITTQILNYPISSLRGKKLNLEVVISKIILGLAGNTGIIESVILDVMPEQSIRPFEKDGMTVNPGIKADDGSSVLKIPIEDRTGKALDKEFWVSIWLQVVYGLYDED